MAKKKTTKKKKTKKQQQKEDMAKARLSICKDCFNSWGFVEDINDPKYRCRLIDMDVELTCEGEERRPFAFFKIIKCDGFNKFPPKLRKMYQEAWDLWGKDSQMDMIVEECNELIKEASELKGANKQMNMLIKKCSKLVKEVCKLKRIENQDFRHIVEEMADVVIMIEQFISVFDKIALYREFVEKKLKRLRRKLDDEHD